MSNIIISSNFPHRRTRVSSEKYIKIEGKRENPGKPRKANRMIYMLR